MGIGKKQSKAERIEKLLKDSYSLGYESGYFGYDSSNEWAMEQVEEIKTEARRLNLMEEVLTRFRSGKEAGQIRKKDDNREGSMEGGPKTKYMEEPKREYDDDENLVEEIEAKSQMEMPSHALKPTFSESPAMSKKPRYLSNLPFDEIE